MTALNPEQRDAVDAWLTKLLGHIEGGQFEEASAEFAELGFDVPYEKVQAMHRDLQRYRRAAFGMHPDENMTRPKGMGKKAWHEHIWLAWAG